MLCSLRQGVIVQTREDDKYNERAHDAEMFYLMHRDHVPCDVFLAITDESDVDEIYCRTCFWALGDHTDDATEG